MDQKTDAKIIQEDIEKLVGWSKIWLLSFNTEKCKVMHIGLRNEMEQYFMEGTEIQIVMEEKDLGVLVDNKVKFSKHIAAAAARANRKLGLLKHTFKYWTEDSLATLYKVFVRPHLEYCIQACSPTLQRDINTLERVQRRATKLVPSLKDLPYDERLKRLQLPSLEDRRRRGDMIETFKILRGYDQVEIEKFFTLRAEVAEREVTRGHQLTIFKQRRNTALRRKFFSHRVVDDWNRLPSHVIEATTVNCFKGRYDKFLERERREL